MAPLRIRHATALAVMSLPLLLYGNFDQAMQPRASRRGETIIVKALVTDALNRYVSDLEPTNFRLVEDRAEQKISYFAHKSAPVSIGIILDTTRTLESRVDPVRKSIERLLGSGQASDEFFLITFDRKSARIESFSHQGSSTEDIPPIGKVAAQAPLSDAFQICLNRMKTRTNEKKAMILISASFNIDLAGEAAKIETESYPQVYSITGGRRFESQSFNVIEMTGGRPYFLTDFGELDYYIGLIHTELRNEYILGYSSSKPVRNGKWRKISVELKLPSGSPKLTVAADKGYYAPKN